MRIILIAELLEAFIGESQSLSAAGHQRHSPVPQESRVGGSIFGPAMVKTISADTSKLLSETALICSS